MTTSSTKGKSPELRVVFDTSVLFTGSASDLLKQEAVELIRQNSQHSDLLLSWYLPEIVLHERLYQMHTAAMELLPSLHKLERLLGHALNINEEIVKQRANEAADKWCQDLQLQRLPLVISSVDWQRLVMDSAYRRPPFQSGEKEKGFRDALIVETFAQLVAASPSTPKVCRLAFVTGDGRLADALRDRMGATSNVRILNSLEELKGLISTLISAVSEEFVAGIQERAKDYFFKKEDNECLLIKEKIRDQIREKFNDVLESLPEGADKRVNGTWWISAPRFVKKQGQRVYWASRITVDAEAYKAAEKTFGTLGELLQGWTLSLPQPLTVPTGMSGLSVPGVSATSLPFEQESKDRLVSNGKSNFEVLWSVVVTTTQKFSHPRVESLAHIGTAWGK